MKNPKRINFKLDFHPEVARNTTGADGLAALYDTVEEINNALTTVKDPRALSKAVAQRSTTALTKARARLTQVRMQSSKIVEDIGAILKKRSIEFEREQRDFVRTSKDPVSAVRRMIAAGEDVGAIFRAPSYLSGLDDQQYGILYQYAKEKFTPELRQKELDADHAADILDRAIETFATESARIIKTISTSDEAIAASLIAPKEPVA